MSASLASNAPQTISEAIIRDHQEIMGSYQKYINSTSESDKEALSNQLRWDLARHTTSEELVLHPAYEKWLGEEGKRIAEQDKLEHQSVKELLAKLSGLNIQDPEFIITLERLIKEMTTHVEGEERDDLPKLEAVISREESLALAKSFERTKFFAPTRAHPKAPFGNVGELLLAPIDRLRDLLASFPDEGASQV